MKKRKIAFICVHNSCRSIMAEGWAKHLGSNLIEAYSAGTEKYQSPKPLAIEVMEDAGVNMQHAASKLIKDIPSEFDIVITMGCGVKCPYIKCEHREDWDLEAPSGKPKFEFEKTRDIIKLKVIDLIERIEKGKL